MSGFCAAQEGLQLLSGTSSEALLLLGAAVCRVSVAVAPPEPVNRELHRFKLLGESLKLRLFHSFEHSVIWKREIFGKMGQVQNCSVSDKGGLLGLAEHVGLVR